MLIESCEFFNKIVMASLSAFKVEHGSMISNLISLRTRIATPPPCLLSLSLRAMMQFVISSLKLLLSHVSFRERMSISFSFRKRDISTSLFLQLRMLICANLSLDELILAGHPHYGCRCNWCISKLLLDNCQNNFHCYILGIVYPLICSFWSNDQFYCM